MHSAVVARTVVAVLATVLLGALVAVLGAFQHPSDLVVGDTRLPVGVIGAIAALLLAELIAREALPLGLGPAVVLLSWTAVVIVLGSSRTEGDLVVPAGLSGEAFLYGGFAAGLVLAGVLAVRGASGAPRDDR